MFNRKVTSRLSAVLAIGSLAVLSGCDWLQGSGSDGRRSPFLSSLSVSASSVLCGDTFSVSFRYDDPQGDIARARVTLLRSGDTVPREETPAWPADISRSSGTARFSFSFPCDSSKGGIWTIRVQVEDDRGNISNMLDGVIRLNAAS